MFRCGRSFLIVTKPSGEIVKREIQLDFDVANQTFDVTFIGESPLKGYKFSVLQSELRRIRDTGVPADAAPRVV